MAEPNAVNDLGVFAEEELLAPLMPHQLALANSKAPLLVAVGGRRSGKSHFAQSKCIHVAATIRNARVLVVSPTVTKSRDFVRDLAGLVRSSRLSDSVVDDQAQRLTFSQGGEIQCLAATSGSVRGRGKDVLLAVLDEAAFLAPSVWSDLRYTLLENRHRGSQAVMISTPWGRPEHFFRSNYFAGVDGDADIAHAKWPTELNSLIPPEEIAKERARLSADEAAVELDAEWRDSAGAYFSGQLLERQTADLVLPEFERLEIAEPLVGCDWGHVKDHCAAVAILRLPIQDLNPGLEPKPRFVLIPKQWPAAQPMHDVWEAVARVPVRFHVLTSETLGVGAAPSQDLRRVLYERGRPPRHWVPCATTAPKKEAGYGALRALLERNQLLLPPDPDLLRQLRGLKYEMRDRGSVGIEAEDEHTHDDLADAAFLATGPYAHVRVKGRIVTALLQLASDRACPDYAIPARWVEGVPVLQTPSGLRVWEHPPLQGVAGHEVWVPEPSQLGASPQRRAAARLPTRLAPTAGDYTRWSVSDRPRPQSSTQRTRR